MDVRYAVDAGGTVCEDIAGSTAIGAWVLDGSSGAIDTDFTNASSDGRWYVIAFDEYLQEHLNDDRPLSEVVRTGIITVRERFDEHADWTAVDRIEQPLCAGVIVREREDYVEYLTSADCSLAIQRPDGTADIILGNGPRSIDREVLENLQQMKREKDLSHDAARVAIRENIVEGRRQLNRPGGYWALSFDERAVDHAQGSTIAADDVDALCLFSDGFERILELYEHLSYEALFERVLRDGPAALIKRLRKIESQDPNCEMYPRIKPSDDAALAVADWSPNYAGGDE